MARPILVAVIGILVGLGFLAGRVTGARTAAVPTSVAQQDLRQELADIKASLEDMRRSLVWGGGRETFAAQAAPAAGAAAAACARDPKTDDTARAARAESERHHPNMQEGEVLVTTALARGTWTEKDILRFRELARDASDLNWVPLMQKVDQAINEGRLKPDLDLQEFH